MKRSCAVCGEEFEAKKPNATFCGATCRKRASRNKAATPAPAAAVAPAAPASGTTVVVTATGLYAVVQAKLTEVDRLNTIAGQHALELANRIVNAPGMNTGVAALSKQLQAVLAEALADSGLEEDPVDELEARRDAKLKRAAG